MIRKTIVAIAIVAMLSGWASFYPLPVNEPKALDENGQRVKPDYQRGGLLPATNIQQAIENTKTYGDAYLEYSDKLCRNEYVSSDTALIGGVLGVVGVIAKSTETAISGAVLASGASIVSERYQFLVQAENYEKASGAMYCMYSNLYPVNGGNVPFDF